MLTLQFLPYAQLQNLNSENKIRKILGLVRENKILLIEGKLHPIEEAELIEKTMEEVNKSFKGIEICTINPNHRSSEAVYRIREAFARIILGNRVGFTIVGPASIVKEIKRDPNKIELLTRELKKSRKRK